MCEKLYSVLLLFLLPRSFPPVFTVTFGTVLLQIISELIFLVNERIPGEVHRDTHAFAESWRRFEKIEIKRCSIDVERKSLIILTYYRRFSSEVCSVKLPRTSLRINLEHATILFDKLVMIPWSVHRYVSFIMGFNFTVIIALLFSDNGCTPLR